MMNYLIQILDIIAWPAVLTIIVYWFKGQLISLLNDVSEIKYKDLSISRRLKEMEGIPPSPISKTTAHTERKPHDWQKLIALSSSEPARAAALAWSNLTDQIHKVCEIMGNNQSSTFGAAGWLYKEGHIDNYGLKVISALENIILDMKQSGPNMSREQSSEFISYAIEVFNKLDAAIPEHTE